MEFKLKQINEDFIVREVYCEPKWCNRGEAAYTILEMRKESTNTFDATSLLAEAFEVDISQVSYSGLKDEDAISTQLIAVEKKLSEEDVNSFNLCNSNIQIYFKGYSKNKLNIGQLHGNVFNITLRNIEKRHRERLSEIQNRTMKIQTINYYDDQRFGIPGAKHNTHTIGRYIYLNQWEKALEEYLESGNAEAEKEKLLRLSERTTCKESFMKCLEPRKMSFMLNSYMSELWNEKVNEFISNSTSDYKIYDKNVMNLNFLKKDARINIEDNYLLYKYYVVKDNMFVLREKYRQIILHTNVMVGEVQKDDIFYDKMKLNVGFFLPAGCYATMLLKQVFSEL